MNPSPDKEKTEDLNPRSNDIEEKVKHLMDLSVPDAPVDNTKAPASKPPAETTTSSAPELPALAKGPRTVKIPITQHGDAIAKTKTPPEDTAPEVKQITISEHNQSPSEVAKELDKAIAGLGPKASVPTAQPQPVNTASEATLADSPLIDSVETDKAVDDIVSKEGDELLEVEDAVRDTDQPVEKVKKPKKSWGKALKSWLTKPAFRWALIIIVVAGLLIAGALPRSRYALLNTAGVRASSSMVILDDSTNQPLKNVQVSIGTVKGVTDVDGKISLYKIKLGPSSLNIEKRGFAPVAKPITIGLGSNPLGDFRLSSTGSQYAFTVTDFLSGKPIGKVEASNNEASALSDDKGVIKLTIDKQGDDKILVSLKGDGYRTEQVEIDPNDKSDHAIKLVPARKQVFVSKRSGKYDIYSVYIDGKEETLVLAGSGSERDDMVLVPHPSAETVAYVSTRGNQHNADGYLLSNLILINTSDNTTTNVDISEQLQIIDWSGDYLIYVQITAGSSADSPNRYRLMAYNFRDDTNKELAHANYFNDVLAAAGAVYYSPSSAYQSGPTNFYKVNPNGTNVQTVFNQEVWNITRSAYDHLALSVQQQWYDYHLGDPAPTKLSNAPANQTSRIYVDSPDIKHSIWSEMRDGKGTLLAYDVAAKSDMTLKAQSGLGYPMGWLNNSVVVYRVKTDQETADYAISIDGGNPVKIRDVTNSGGIDRWYH